jgi:hypothetical protein
MKINKKNLFTQFIILLTIISTSCNNFFQLDDLIDQNLNTVSYIPTNDGIIIDGFFTDWDNIPFMLSNDTSTYQGINFKMAINSSRTNMYFYFKTASQITPASQSYVVVISNDLNCSGLRILLSNGLTSLYPMCNDTILISPGTSSTVTGNQIEGTIPLNTYLTYAPLNEKVHISVYMVYASPAVYPINSYVPGKWVLSTQP